MTVVVTVKINDGIVLATDSAVSFFDPAGTPLKIYTNANKVFNLVKGYPIGVMYWGAGGIGLASLATITKDLRQRFAGEDETRKDWSLAPDYTMESVAVRLRQFLFEDRFAAAYGLSPPIEFFLGCKVCGYSAKAELPEVWDIRIVGDKSDPTVLTQPQEQVGVRWDGEYEAMDRLIFGVGSTVRKVLTDDGLPQEQADKIADKLIEKLGATVVLAAMPIQDAIDLASFMVETTIRFVRFNLRAETVGGPIEIAAITKHEGFKWINRKYFYQTEMNL